ncbi:MAG: polysulfide reductase NrfD [Candidatus Kapabacteria bacterium]|jgi:protein NrfD|nr:polysulfide reductase NrfD [Candidatus Kapabacteria bacterium]
MHELIITRSNHLIDPIFTPWGWEIPIYLFLGGLVAGMMIISGYFILSGRHQKKDCSCFVVPTVALALISIGMTALFLDLEHKLYVWRLYTTFQWTSPMSWGAWILLLVYPILTLNAILKIPENIAKKLPWLKNIGEKLSGRKFAVKVIGAMSMISGGILGMYTGVLLSTLVARPAWNSSMLWILFLVSGLSAAAAFIHLFAKREDERRLLAKADNGFLIAELMIVALIIIGFLTSSEVQNAAAMLFINGPYAAVFWVFVVGLGMVVPLFIQLFAVNDKIQHTPIAPIMVMVGGLILRFVIVSAGQYSGWFTGTFTTP